MHPGANGPPIPNGGNNNYDRVVCFDAPVAMDTGLYVFPEKTLSQLRADMMVRLGYAAMLANPPPGMKEELNSYLQDAQEQMYYRYSVMRTERWWAWQLQPGQRFYDTPIDCTKALNFRKITWAGIADNGGRALQLWKATTAYTAGQYVLPLVHGEFEYEVTVAGTTGAAEPAWPTTIGATVVDGTVTFTARAASSATWYPIFQGINPLDYGCDTPGYPTNFELREYIEVWPPPDKPLVLWLKGHMGLKRFTEDSDVPTIDTEVVFLFALAMAKAHRGQPDANNYASMATRMVNNMVAASHGVQRYIPRPSTAGMKYPYSGDGYGPLWPMPIATFR